MTAYTYVAILVLLFAITPEKASAQGACGTVYSACLSDCHGKYSTIPKGTPASQWSDYHNKQTACLIACSKADDSCKAQGGVNTTSTQLPTPNKSQVAETANVNGGSSARSLFSRGFELLQQRRLPEAQKAFEDGLRIEPTEYRAHYFLGGICEVTKTCSFAQSYHAVLKHAPRESEEYSTAQRKAGHIPQSDYSRYYVPKVGSKWEVAQVFEGKSNTATSLVSSVTSQDFVVETKDNGTTLRSRYGPDGNSLESEYAEATGGVVKITYSPSDRWLDFPLSVGKTWGMNHVEDSRDRRSTITGRATVKGYETVSSKKGDIEAMRIEFRTTDRTKLSTGEEFTNSVSGVCLYVPGIPGCYILLDEKGETIMAVVNYDLRF